jgi:hypothetical protein
MSRYKTEFDMQSEAVFKTSLESASDLYEAGKEIGRTELEAEVEEFLDVIDEEQKNIIAEQNNIIDIQNSLIGGEGV